MPGLDQEAALEARRMGDHHVQIPPGGGREDLPRWADHGGGHGVRQRVEHGQRPRLLDRMRRSEEHTSELQSQSNLVCRLLLEKKKKKRHKNIPVEIVTATTQTTTHCVV